MSRIGPRHWLVVLVIAVAVHAALLIRFQVDDTLTATHTGAQGVRIALAPRQGKPKPTQATADAAQEKENADNKTPPPAPKPEPRAQTEPAPKPAAKPKPEPTKVPKPKPAPEPKQKSQPEPERKPPKPAPKPQPKPTPEPKPRPRSQQPPREREPEPTPSKKSRQATHTDNARPTDGQDRSHTPAQANQASERTRKGTTGRVSDTPPDYRSALGAALQRHKNYPRRARRLGQEGTVVLHFVIDRSGQVLDWEIRKSSGHKLLDSAVRDMIRQADPLPAMPDSVSMQRLAVTVPISFRLR